VIEMDQTDPRSDLKLTFELKIRPFGCRAVQNSTHRSKAPKSQVWRSTRTRKGEGSALKPTLLLCKSLLLQDLIWYTRQDSNLRPSDSKANTSVSIGIVFLRFE